MAVIIINRNSNDCVAEVVSFVTRLAVVVREPILVRPCEAAGSLSSVLLCHDLRRPRTPGNPRAALPNRAVLSGAPRHVERLYLDASLRLGGSLGRGKLAGGIVPRRCHPAFRELAGRPRQTRLTQRPRQGRMVRPLVLAVLVLLVVPPGVVTRHFGLVVAVVVASEVDGHFRHGSQVRLASVAVT